MTPKLACRTTSGSSRPAGCPRSRTSSRSITPRALDDVGAGSALEGVADGVTTASGSDYPAEIVDAAVRGRGARAGLTGSRDRVRDGQLHRGAGRALAPRRGGRSRRRDDRGRHAGAVDGAADVRLPGRTLRGRRNCRRAPSPRRSRRPRSTGSTREVGVGRRSHACSVLAGRSHCSPTRDFSPLDQQHPRTCWNGARPDVARAGSSAGARPSLDGIEARLGNVSEAWGWLNQPRDLTRREAAVLLRRRAPDNRVREVEETAESVIAVDAHDLDVPRARCRRPPALEDGLNGGRRPSGRRYPSDSSFVLVTGRRRSG